MLCDFFRQKFSNLVAEGVDDPIDYRIEISQKIAFAIRIAFAAQSIRHCRNLQASRIAFSPFRFSLLGVIQSRRIFLRFCLTTHRREKTPSEQASKQRVIEERR